MTRTPAGMLAGAVLSAILAAVPAPGEDALRIADPARRLQALKEALAPQRRGSLNGYDRVVRCEATANTLRELKRYEELRSFLAELEGWEPDRARKPQWCYLLAEAYREDGQPAAALPVYERVFTDYPENGAHWQDAQTRIVDALVALARLDDALKAAHVLWDAARDAGAAERAAVRMADILKAIDGNPARGDAAFAMRRFGPAGRDGKPGTADDPASAPAPGYPDGTARRKAFDAAAPSLGDGAAAALQRALGCLYAGDPRAAMPHSADALRRCRSNEAAATAKAVLHNVRALRQHGADPDDVARFIAYGASGPDGVPGGGDDLPDPFPELGVSAAPRLPGGAVRLEPAEVASLQALVRELRAYALRADNPGRQAGALNAYERACEALVVFDRGETLGWVMAGIRAGPDDRVLGALVRLGQTVAKADQLDLSGIRRFNVEVTRTLEQAQRAPPEAVQEAQRQTEAAVQAMDRTSAQGRQR